MTMEEEIKQPKEQQETQQEPQEQQEQPKKKNSKMDELRKKNEELSAKLSKEHDDYLRLMAEFETFRRRSAEDRLSLIASASADTIKGLLPVLDDCERAMQLLEESSDEAAKQGTSLIYNKLMEYLKSKGLAVVQAKGETFDAELHEAVTQIPAPSEDMKGKILDVIQTGYTLNGKILRYPKVVVGA